MRSIAYILSIMVFVLASVAMAQEPLRITSVGKEPEGFDRLFKKQVDVFGIAVFATGKCPDEKVLHAAGVLAQYLDNDADGQPDNELVVRAIRKSKGAVTMFSTEREILENIHYYIPEEVWDEMYTMGLHEEEVHPGGAARGVFDATYEEILHLITAAGYANVYPDVFGERPGTVIARAMDKARGGHFRIVPKRYSEKAWYSYDDRTCDYACQITEYIYWGLTSILGAQDFPGRGENISVEWKLNTAAKVRQGDPSLYKLLTDMKYAFPMVLPDGRYKPRKITERANSPDAKNGFAWPSAVPDDCPFERSNTLTGIFFTGRHSDYRCGDTFYPSWASDGNLYSPWTDGVTDGVRSNSGGSLEGGFHTGHAVMIGADPLKLIIKNTSPLKKAFAVPYRGRYPCGSLVHDGIWYYGTYCLGPSASFVHGDFKWNWPNLGPMPGFHISRDLGKTWHAPPSSLGKPLFPEPNEFLGPVKMGAPHFVDFGKNMEHSPDGKAYLLGMGAEIDDPHPRPCIKAGPDGTVYEMNESCGLPLHLRLRDGEAANKDFKTVFERAFQQIDGRPFTHGNLSWITADQVYLTRVKPSPETINDIKAYEFFAGHDAAGKPVWTPDFKKIEPLIEWNNHMGCVTATYVPGLKKYLMCITDGWPTVAKMTSYILEANEITGPWRMAAYMKDFGEQAYFLNFPSKFISEDGRTLWLCYSANFSPGWNGVDLKFNPPGGRYGLCLHEVELLGPNDAGSSANKPLKTAR